MKTVTKFKFSPSLWKGNGRKGVYRNNSYGLIKAFNGLKLYTPFCLQIVCVFSDPKIRKLTYIFMFFILSVSILKTPYQHDFKILSLSFWTSDVDKILLLSNIWSTCDVQKERLISIFLAHCEERCNFLARHSFSDY